MPLISPGLVDVHVHGWGGHSAMGAADDLDGMARALLQRGVTSFLPTAVTASLDGLHAFAERVRGWSSRAPADGAQALGFNLEGPFISAVRAGAHDVRLIRNPAEVSPKLLEPLIDGLRLITVAPETAGGLELIGWLSARGVAVSVGHSAADLETSRAAYRAGATGTTHLFNAMSGLHHRAPGLAAAALTTDDAFVELIADGHHVDRALWPLIMRAKPAARVVLVSDALSLAGTDARRARLGTLDIERSADRLTLAGTDTLAGSALGLDTAVRNLVANGATVPYAIATASRNPLALIRLSDRGRLAEGQRADLVELDAELRVRRVMRGGKWVYAA